MIEVVAGIITIGQRLLLTQRLATDELAHCWECPGGHVKEGETYYMALFRELHEEVGIEILRYDSMPVARVKLGIPTSEREELEVIFIRIRGWNGNPRPMEGQGIGWFPRRSVPWLDLSPGNEHGARDIERSAFGY
jgi:8-oxo-dGTP diphosphatase